MSEFGFVCSRCQNTGNSHFKNFKMEFVRRQTNEAVHLLARAFICISSFHIMTDINVCIQTIIIDEMF